MEGSLAAVKITILWLFIELLSESISVIYVTESIFSSKSCCLKLIIMEWFCVCVCCVCACVWVCVYLHNRRCEDQHSDAHQHCGIFLSCGHKNLVPTNKSNEKTRNEKICLDIPFHQTNFKVPITISVFMIAYVAGTPVKFLTSTL